MSNEQLFNMLVNGYLGSLSAGINAVLIEKKPISFGVQCVIKSLDTDDKFFANVYNGKKGVRIVLQGEDSDLLELAKTAFPTGVITKDVISNWKPVYI